MGSNYFEEAIATGQPIVPPTQPSPVSAPTPGSVGTTSDDFKGLPVRAGGDRIFLIKGGKRAWITSAEVYEKLGFKFGDEKQIDLESLNTIPEGDPIR